MPELEPAVVTEHVSAVSLLPYNLTLMLCDFQ